MCAKIFIIGRDPIETNKDEAVRINEMWIASKEKGKGYVIPEVLEAGGQTFLSKDIKGFDFTSGMIKQGIDEYDLSDQAQKDKIKSFEKKLNDWEAQHPEITEWHECEYLQGQGVLKMGKTRQDDVIINTGDNCKKYNELKKMFASLQTLKYYREKAQAENDPDYEATRVARFKEMKEQIFGKREPAPALEKIKADVCAYDEEIDVLIPF